MQNYNENQNVKKLKGIGGWLLIFILIVLVVTPLQVLIQLLNVRDFSIYTIINLILGISSVYTGIKLLKISPAAVTIAKIFLIASLIYSLIIYIIVFTTIMEQSYYGSTIFITILQIVISIVKFIIWYSYFSLSKRVQATYFKNFQVQQIEINKMCPNCGNIFQIESVYCDKCGTKLNEQRVDVDIGQNTIWGKE